MESSDAPDSFRVSDRIVEVDNDDSSVGIAAQITDGKDIVPHPTLWQMMPDESELQTQPRRPLIETMPEPEARRVIHDVDATALSAPHRETRGNAADFSMRQAAAARETNDLF